MKRNIDTCGHNNCCCKKANNYQLWFSLFVLLPYLSGI